MPYYCTVPRCTSMAGKTRDVSFHQFPRDSMLAEQWNVILRRGKPYTKYSKVCSRHFTAADYTMTSVGKNKGTWRTLRKDAVPSQNLPSDDPVPQSMRAPSSNIENMTEQQVTQQLAHAVYVQTMLAMHAANIATMRPSIDENVRRTSDPHEGLSNGDEDSRDYHNSTDPPIWSSPLNPVCRSDFADALPHNHTASIKPTKTSFECEECSKCFKDPDVFVLHKRWHASKSQETVNFNNPSVDHGLDVENTILVAMKTNMENYIKGMLCMNVLNGNSDRKSDDDMNEDSGRLVIDENALG